MRTLLIAAVAAVLGAASTAGAAGTRFVMLGLGDSARVTKSGIVCHVQTGPTTGREITCGPDFGTYAVVVSDRVAAVLNERTGYTVFLRYQARR